MMKAAVIDGYGEARRVLSYREDLLAPRPSKGQVLVRNRASSVNPVDLAKREGFARSILEPGRRPRFPWIIGSDLAGVVEGVGPGVWQFRVGDEVFGAPTPFGQGTYADQIAVSEWEIATKPASLTFEEAASLPYVACTTWASLVGCAGLSAGKAAGKKVLVNGGSGGIGTFAIQLLKAWGCHVAATCSTGSVDLVADLGADEVIAYEREDFAERLHGYDIVYDTVGHKVAGNERRCLSVLKRHGGAVYVTVAHPLLATLDRNGVLAGAPRAFATFAAGLLAARASRYRWGLFMPSGEALNAVRQLVEDGAIRPVIDRVFRLSEIADAHEYLAKGHVRGKIALTTA